MKKMILMGLVLSAMVWMVAACSSNSGSINNPVVMTPTPTPVATATPAPKVVSLASGPSFSPAAVTISAGQTVIWDSSLAGHNLTLDNFPGTSGSCAPTINTTTFPVTQAFPTTGTYYYHCGFHSGCGSGSCGVCGGGLNMIGNVVVN